MPSDSSDVIISDSNYNDSTNTINEDQSIAPDTSPLNPTPRYISNPIVDDNGLIRIGPQPYLPSRLILWAPIREASLRIHNQTRANYNQTDRKIHTGEISVDMHDAQFAAIKDKLPQRHLTWSLADCRAGSY
jgi:hypothetical protein